MTRLFYGFVTLGMALVILVAAIYPLPLHQRYRSSISVIPDGGRAETFTMQWPQDRVQSVIAATAAGSLVAGGASSPPLNGAPGASAEIFRLRDAAGNVIGLASRSTSMRRAREGAAGQGSDWVLVVPSRGALFLTQANSRDVTPRSGPSGGGLQAAEDAAAFWDGATRLQITAGPTADGAGQVVGGSEEFADMSGSYDETWQLEEAAADGSTRGRITLDTRVEAAR